MDELSSVAESLSTSFSLEEDTGYFSEGFLDEEEEEEHREVVHEEDEELGDAAAQESSDEEEEDYGSDSFEEAHHEERAVAVHFPVLSPLLLLPPPHAATVESLEREVARLQARDIKWLTGKQSRANRRRQEHCAALASAQKQLELTRRSREAERTKADATLQKLVRAENEVVVQAATVQRLVDEHEALREKLRPHAEELALERQRRTDLGRTHDRAVEDAHQAHLAEMTASRAELARFRQKVADEQEATLSEAMAKARAHEARVERLQHALEAELVSVDRERRTLSKARADLHAQVDGRRRENAHGLERERRQLQEEKAEFERAARKAKVAATERDSELEDLRRSREAEASRLREERQQLAGLRGCVEAERDKLSAARQEAGHVREVARSTTREAERRGQAALAQAQAASREAAKAREAKRSCCEKVAQLTMLAAELEEEQEEVASLKASLSTAVSNTLLHETRPGDATARGQAGAGHLPMNPPMPVVAAHVPRAVPVGAEEPSKSCLWESELVAELLDFSTLAIR